MTNQLQVFKNEQFGKVRTLTIDNEPWFVAIDVCKILGLRNPTMAIDRLDKDEVTKLNLGSKSGITNIVNEYGLYTLILASRKKEAKQFKRWITHEVLPSIRQTGTYITNQNEPLSQATLFIKRELEKLNTKYTKLEKEYKKLLKNNGTTLKQLALPYTIPQLNNSIYSWINTCQINLNLVLNLPTTYLYEHYNEYCKKQNIFQIGKKTFYRELKQIFNLHYRTYQKTDGKRYFKIG